MKAITIILEAFQGAYLYKFDLLQRLIPPIAIVSMLAILTNDLSNSFLNAALMIVYLFVAITTHRVILLGPKSVPRWGHYIPTGQEVLFFFYFIVTSLMLFPAGLLYMIPGVGLPLAVSVMFFLVARFSLIFPAIATDHHWNLSDAWHASRGHTVTMVIIVCIFPGILSMLDSAVSAGESLIFFYGMVSTLITVLTISALSVAFKAIHGNPNERLELH